MSQVLRRVSILGTGSFLPNDPIPNERLDDVLGPLNGAPRKVKGFVEKVGRRMLASSGIESRHFAIDPETHRLTHTVASLAEEAGRRALEAACRKPTDVELLLLSSPIYDQATPPTSASLQERLGIEHCTEMEIHANCSGVGKCMQIAFDALRLGRYKSALVTYPQLSSLYLRGCYFNQAQMTSSQAALRYILADGSGAVYMEGVDADEDTPIAHEVLGAYVESVGGKLPPAMTAGCGASDLVDCASQLPGVYERGSHHLDQDFAAVNRDAGPVLLEGVRRMVESLNIDPRSVDHHVYSIPGKQLYEGNLPRFAEQFGVTSKELAFRGRGTGYCGGASLLLHFDEMVRSGEIRPGQLVVVHSVESSKWMSGGFVVRW